MLNIINCFDIILLKLDFITLSKNNLLWIIELIKTLIERIYIDLKTELLRKTLLTHAVTPLAVFEGVVETLAQRNVGLIFCALQKLFQLVTAHVLLLLWLLLCVHWLLLRLLCVHLLLLVLRLLLILLFLRGRSLLLLLWVRSSPNHPWNSGADDRTCGHATWKLFVMFSLNLFEKNSFGLISVASDSYKY